MPDQTDAPELLCSFCSQPRSAVKFLVVGPGVNICVKCVEICNEVIVQEEVRYALASNRFKLTMEPINVSSNPNA